MPYIPHNRRYAVHIAGDARTAGELNYAITQVLVDYVRIEAGPISYAVLNDCLGALEGAKLEFYRRVVVPYEQEKMKTNGDVY